MIKYYPYKSDKPNKNITLLQMIIKKVYFGQAPARGFDFHGSHSEQEHTAAQGGVASAVLFRPPTHDAPQPHSATALGGAIFIL